MAEITSWESLSISGRYIIQQICDTIDDSDFFCADITTMNPNVMYELGYAIGRDKRVWLIREDSYADPKGEFDQLRLLSQRLLMPWPSFICRRRLLLTSVLAFLWEVFDGGVEFSDNIPCAFAGTSGNVKTEGTLLRSKECA